MALFTVFCCASDHEFGDTIHIDTVDADDAMEAAVKGRFGCANDWSCGEDKVEVLGVAQGNVLLAEWDDNGLDLPAPRQLTAVKIDFDAWPGAPFQGGHIIELEVLDDLEEMRAELVGQLEELLDGVADDDGAGAAIPQITTVMEKVVEAWVDDGDELRFNLVLASGRYKLDEDGEPLIDDHGQEIFDEKFDISVSIFPVVEEVESEDEGE